MKIKCLVIDDEPLAVQLLCDYIEQVPFLTLEKTCYNAMEALDFMQLHKVDLIFLDINMPHITGMAFAGLLDKQQKVIFTTAYTDYALESYEKNAVDYLLKPITFERFMKAVTKVVALSKDPSPVASSIERETDTESVFVKTGKSVVKVELKKVLYIEGLKDYVIFYLDQEKHIVYKRMKELEDILPEYFHRIHNSYIVNVHTIHKIEDNHIYIHDIRLPISEKYRVTFMQIIQQKLL
ncbi:LytTR family DNA-binding domain-containing protein [Xanthocytophaga agilis]|uniref:LytTR family DNA-binding domain-containing protein n=1 Tax=Xanthocytophaga agilis TaxID=3048010 RepID=A0AAE3R608_9BACT|nr:LytTR family DNA-binding domain-containing protein [Xanthocytophaga agilis]MDJ1504506.1 LytTR family DNA-binding domain-containing protein [Xanthocytophaga agilis]